MVSTSFAAPIGEILDDKFRVTREIGRGGMAVVYSAENVDIGKRVAVKILSEDLATSKTVTERFLREARAAAKIHSPYICEVYDVGTYDGRPFIVMELLQGESLYDRLARDRQLSVDETLRIAIQTAKGLRKAHEMNVVHRDLKPENIFLTTGEDGGPHTKLVDFGLAKFYEPAHDAASARLTKEGALFGTPAYMSPEQAKGKGNVDQRSDLWALGCIVFEMLTGRTVWDVEQGVAMILAQIASSPLPKATEFRPDLPPSFDSWLEKALARKPEARFSGADEFVVALQAALRPEEASSAGPITPEDPLPPAAAASPMPFRPPVAPGAAERSAARTTDPSQPRSRRWWYAAVAFALGGSVGGWFVFDGFSLPGGEAPAESAPFSKEIASAQKLLANGDIQESINELKVAFDKGQGKAARSLLTHVSASKDMPGGSCTLTGIGHPRPFESSGESSKPTMLPTEQGTLVTWADKVASTGMIQARTSLLDEALRRTTAVVNATPEANTTRDPELFRLEDGLGLLFWDFGGDRPGAYTRVLDVQGAPKGPPRLLSSSERTHPYYPALAADDDGTFWVVWVEPSRDRVFDLVVRHLDKNLEPLDAAVAITGYATPVGGKTQAARPSIAVFGKLLVISYTLRRGTKQHVMMLRVNKQQAAHGPSVVPDDRPQTLGDEESDRFLGQVVSVNEAAGNHGYSTVRCGDAGCFVAWDDAQNAGYLAYADASGNFVWRRSLGAGTARPGIAWAKGAKRGMLAYFDKKRVLVAPFDNQTIDTPTVIGRVSAALKQPPPWVVRTQDSNEQWYVGWRGYEAAVPEPFVAKVSCE